MIFHRRLVYTKIHFVALATKIFKNIGILFKTIIANLVTIIDNSMVVFGAMLIRLYDV